jgi:tetratricopeptide (TPR) repeat protein
MNKTKQRNKPDVINRKLLLRLALILFTVSFLLYANTLHHAYVLDDSAAIKDNTLTKGGIHSIKEIFSTSFRTGYSRNENSIYRPLSKAMFALEWQLSPNKPFLGHFINVIMFAFICMLLFIVMVRYIKFNIYILFIGALLYAVHPIHTEVVANIKSRDELLSALFCLLSLWLISKYINTSKILLLLSALLCFFLALFSKESAIVYAAIVPLTLYFLTDANIKTNLKITIPIIITAIIYLFIHLKVIGIIGIPNIHPIDNPLLMASSFALQKASAIFLLGKYLLLLFIPYSLSCDYGFNSIPLVTSFGNPLFLLPLIVHVSLLLFAIAKFKQKHFLSYCILFYFISMAVASNMFMIIGTNLAERLLFFPSIAFVMAIAYLIGKLSKINFKTVYPPLIDIIKNRAIAMLFLAFIIILFSVKTISRNRDWKSNMTLFEKDLKTYPDNTHLLLYHADNLTLKDTLARLNDEQKKYNLEIAQREIQRALSIYEMIPDAHEVAGRILYEYKDYDNALKEYSRASSFNPGFASYHNNMGTCYFSTARYKEAAYEFKKATELNNSDADEFCNLGSAYGAMGESFGKAAAKDSANKYLSMAIDNFKIATELNPQYKSAFLFLGITYKNMGDTLNGKKYIDIADQLK